MKLAVVGPRNLFLPEVFLSDGPEYLEDRSSCFIRILKKRLGLLGMDLVHCDEIPPKEAWGYLFINHEQRFIKKLNKAGYQGKLFLIVFESELVQPDNWTMETLRLYDTVFTWGKQEKMAAGEGLRIVRFFWPNPLDLAEKHLSFTERKKLTIMIAANKWKRRPNELYTERFRAILWFMKNHPEDFDLYGHDWDISPGKRLVEYVRNWYRSMKGNQIRPIQISSVYRGTTRVKKDVLRNYRFCICYENAENFPGYITEKIFDCFIAGVVPVYLGWTGAGEIIPEDTFIDKRQFPDYESLYSRLVSMKEEEYSSYLSSAARFLSSEAGRRFDASSFVEILIKGMGLP